MGEEGKSAEQENHVIKKRGCLKHETASFLYWESADFLPGSASQHACFQAIVGGLFPQPNAPKGLLEVQAGNVADLFSVLNK
jgi:hypothetical protein